MELIIGFIRISLFRRHTVHPPVSYTHLTGIGIAKEDQERIFERFYRVDKSHSRETGGTGLGLSIVKHGAILHDAKIKIESTLGTGTKICLLYTSRCV